MELAYDRHEGGDLGTFVLLHSLALDRHVWDGLLPRLRAHGDVVALDLPNHGASPTLEETSIEGMADALVDTVAAEAPGGAIVLGLSLGGCVAQAFAVRHPERTVGLGLFDTTCWYGETAPADWAGRAQKAVDQGMSSLADFQIARWFSPGFTDGHAEIAQQLLETFQANDLDRYVATCHAMGAMDLRDRLPGIEVPTTIVVGADDPATSPPHAEMMRQLIPDASMHVLPRTSHLSAVEASDPIGRLLEADLVPRLRG